MAFPDRKTVNVLLTALLFVTVLGVIYLARTVLIVFCFSILFAYLIDPVVSFLDRYSFLHRRTRGIHITEAYLGLLLVLALTIYGLVPQASSRPAAFFRNIATFGDRLGSGELAMDLGQTNGWTEERTLRAKQFLTSHHETIKKAASQLQSLAASILGAAVVIPILSIFLLADGQRLADMALATFATEQNRERLQSSSREINSVLRHYIRAKMTLVGLSLTYVSVSLLVLRYPHALALGVLAGLLEFIPIVGWITTATTIIGYGMLTHNHWIWMAVLLGVWRVLIDYWIAPRVLGHELEIHPLLAILVLMLGAAVAGFVGVYLALPTAAVIRVIWRTFDISRNKMPTVPTLQEQAATP